jgi:hypothetical protein
LYTLFVWEKPSTEETEPAKGSDSKGSGQIPFDIEARKLFNVIGM